MLNLGNPELAFKTRCFPTMVVAWRAWSSYQRAHQGSPDGAGQPEKITSARAAGNPELVRNYPRLRIILSKTVEGVGISERRLPKPVIVRLSDFKTNEYARLLAARF